MLLLTERRLSGFILAIFLLSALPAPAQENSYREDNLCRRYKTIGLGKKLDFEVFKNAFRVSENLDFEKDRYLTIIDYSKPSDQKRFFVIDKKENRLLYQEYAAHGMNTGNNHALEFSNVSGSKKSSLGFFRTGKSYTGRNGYSMRLTGLEEGINDNAHSRAIVIHGASYVSEDFIAKNGRLGRSWGCPALPPGVNERIINLIKDGSCLFISAGSRDYAENSAFYQSEK